MKTFVALAAVVALCPILLAGAAVVVLCGTLVSWHPFWNEPTLTMPEAAALNDRATIQRMIWNGADPNAPAPVRPPILKSTAIVVIPIEAAVGTRTPTTLEFLLSRGARMTGHERDVVYCLAAKDDAQEIVRFLETHGDQPKPDCEHVATPW